MESVFLRAVAEKKEKISHVRNNTNSKFCVDDTSRKNTCVFYFTWDALGCSGTRLDGVSAST